MFKVHNLTCSISIKYTHTLPPAFKRAYLAFRSSAGVDPFGVTLVEQAGYWSQLWRLCELKRSLRGVPIRYQLLFTSGSSEKRKRRSCTLYLSPDSKRKAGCLLFSQFYCVTMGYYGKTSGHSPQAPLSATSYIRVLDVVGRC